jgi:hypothetical protein
LVIAAAKPEMGLQMSVFLYLQTDRLSNLYAQGKLSNAQERAAQLNLMSVANRYATKER